jgi:hypothetical protein
MAMTRLPGSNVDRMIVNRTGKVNKIIGVVITDILPLYLPKLGAMTFCAAFRLFVQD